MPSRAWTAAEARRAAAASGPARTSSRCRRTWRSAGTRTVGRECLARVVGEGAQGRTSRGGEALWSTRPHPISHLRWHRATPLYCATPSGTTRATPPRHLAPATCGQLQLERSRPALEARACGQLGPLRSRAALPARAGRTGSRPYLPGGVRDARYWRSRYPADDVGKTSRQTSLRKLRHRPISRAAERRCPGFTSMSARALLASLRRRVSARRGRARAHPSPPLGSQCERWQG